MKYKSALVTDLSGSIEGLTASRNKGGQYFRARVIPTNPQTARQSTARQAFTQVSQSWSQTSSSEKESWEQIAPLVPATGPLGQDVSLSGQQAYQKALTPVQFIKTVDPSSNLTLPTSAPTNPTGSPTSVSPTISGSDQVANTVTVAFEPTDPWANDDNGALEVFMKQPAPAGKKPQDMQERFVASIPGSSTTPPTSPFISFAPWEMGPADLGKAFTMVTVTIQPDDFMPGQRDETEPAQVN